MTAALALATFAALCLAVRLAMHVTEHGLIGTGYLLSAWFHAFSDGLLYGKRAYAEYRRQALDAAPRPVIDVPVEPASNPSALPVRTRPALLGRLARIAGRAARRPAVWRVPTRERVEGSA